MTALITDETLEKQIIAARRASGADRYDEVWEGIYVLAPLANNQHQRLASRLTSVIDAGLGFDEQIDVLCGANVSDQASDWKFNYRIPDVLVYLADNASQDHDTHWTGGPDFLIEVVSRNDQTYEKLPFYEQIKVREMLIVDRDPWKLELRRLDAGKLQVVATSTTDTNDVVQCETIPFSFQLTAGDKRPRITVTQIQTNQTWTI